MTWQDHLSNTSQNDDAIANYIDRDINKTKIMSESHKEIYMFLNWTYLEVQKSEEVHPDKRISPWPHVHQHYCECMPQEQQIDKECESLRIVKE